MKKHHFYLLIVICLLLTSCGRSQQDIDAEIATKVAESIEATREFDQADNTKIIAKAVQETREASMDELLESLMNPPTETPGPPATFDKESKTLDGALYADGGLFNHPVITFIDVKIKPEDYNKTTVIIYLEMTNPNEGIKQLGDKYFVAIDDNGVILETEYSGEGCDVRMVNVLPGGSLKGCIAFEVDDTGHLMVVYAPYENDRFGEGRTITWDIKY